MDERAINGAAIEAIRDLEVDCEIKEVCKGSEADEWCVQFSGKYGSFCDKFQNQFGQENSPEVMREKIKAFLIKQVAKIRSSTGRKRKPVAAAGDDRDSASRLLTEPLKLVGEVFSRATGMATQVVSQASAVAETARATLSAADLGNTNPVTAGVQATALETQPKAPPKTTGRTIIKLPPGRRRRRSAPRAKELRRRPPRRPPRAPRRRLRKPLGKPLAGSEKRRSKEITNHEVTRNDTKRVVPTCKGQDLILVRWRFVTTKLLQRASIRGDDPTVWEKYGMKFGGGRTVLSFLH